MCRDSLPFDQFQNEKPLSFALLKPVDRGDAVLSEIFKTFLHRGVEPRIYFWRTAAGSEVDIVVEADGRLIPIEVKLSSTPQPAMSASIRTFQSDLAGRSTSGYVFHGGTIRLPLGPNVVALAFSDL